MYGRQQKEPRWKECTKSTRDPTKYATSAMYMRKAFDKKALYKAKKTLHLVAYPDFILDDKKVDKQYEGMHFNDEDSYDEYSDDGINRLKMYLMPEYVFNSAVVYAYYDTQNSISKLQRRQYDALGNLNTWWDEDVKKKFEKRAQCFVDQYSKIEVPGTNHVINGELTLGENIADNGGVKQAYKAYKAFLQRYGGNEKRIKGLEKYDNDQMFFMLCFGKGF
ncbi:unnamed protein product [Cylicocyclus nassatus]|uniref:Peptidase M13 C-terminal domain-containing protein n=1 Tax=Cylicocyclus nassatus TaxID=53992 RepID=A0AA36HCU2_CYLNA|nr:unnamed protein product [Cylicocyclus nassatus]